MDQLKPVFCGGFRFAYEASGCRNAANEIEGRRGNVALPFREGFASCHVAAEQKCPDLEMPASQLAIIIRQGVDLCENQEYVGKISDISNSVVDVFFGNLCGAFRFWRRRLRCDPLDVVSGVGATR